MKRTTLFSLCLFFFPLLLTAQYSWKWAGAESIGDIKSAIAMASDHAGNIYITGNFADTCVFWGDTVVTQGQSDMFIISFDSTGNMRWLRSGGGPLQDIPWDICVSGKYLYVTGIYDDHAVFGQDTLVSVKVRDVFLLKYDLEGNLVWAVSGGSTGEDYGYCVAADDSDNVYIAGDIGWSATFGDIYVPRIGGASDIFLAKYDSTGTCRWAKSLGSSTSYDHAADIKVVKDDLFLGGGFTGTILFDTAMFAAVEYNDIYVAHYKTDGKFVDVGVAGGRKNDILTFLAVDESLNVFITGYFFDDLIIGNTILHAGTSPTNLLALYKPGKGFVRVKTYRNFQAWDLEYAGDNSFLLSGSFDDTLTLGQTHLGTMDGHQAFLAAFDSTGTFGWALETRSSSSFSNHGGEVAAGSSYFLTGVFSGEMTAGSQVLTTAGSFGMFLAKAGEGAAFVGQEELSSSVEISVTPNPAADHVRISYHLPDRGHVKIDLYDAGGKYLRTLVDDFRPAGDHSASLGVTGLPPGVYFLRLSTDHAGESVKMMVVKQGDHR